MGDDALGAFVLALLDERGVDPGGVVVDSTVATSATIVLVDLSGERTFLHLTGASASLRADELDRAFLFSGRASISPAPSSWRSSTASRARMPSRRRSHAGS